MVFQMKGGENHLRELGRGRREDLWRERFGADSVQVPTSALQDPWAQGGSWGVCEMLLCHAHAGTQAGANAVGVWGQLVQDALLCAGSASSKAGGTTAGDTPGTAPPHFSACCPTSTAGPTGSSCLQNKATAAAPPK